MGQCRGVAILRRLVEKRRESQERDGGRDHGRPADGALTPLSRGAPASCPRAGQGPPPLVRVHVAVTGAWISSQNGTLLGGKPALLFAPALMCLLLLQAMEMRIEPAFIAAGVNLGDARKYAAALARDGFDSLGDLIHGKALDADVLVPMAIKRGHAGKLGIFRYPQRAERQRRPASS